MRGPFGILRHAFKMVRRTLRSYALLSVTIVLSFSLLLGYLVYTDSTLYNRYKYTMSMDPGSVAVSAVGADEINRLTALQNRLEGMENTHCFITKIIQCSLTQAKLELEDGREVRLPRVNVVAVPTHCWRLYADSSSDAVEVEWLDGRTPEDVSLASGEMLMSAGLFHALGLEQTDEPVYHLDLSETYGVQSKTGFQASMKVVGTFRVTKLLTVSSDILTEEILTGGTDGGDRSAFIWPTIVIPLEDYDPEQMDGVVCQYVLHVYTDTPALAVQAARQLGFAVNVNSSWQAQQDAIEKMQTANRTKAVIAAAMLIILGINLYSSFSNALNERKFEIGVKRAIGASAWAIVRQFLYESLLVMTVNILLSVALVTDLSILYKVIYEATPNEYGFYYRFTLCLSRWSAEMFAVCTLSLTVVFSLIFAYQSTQVEIVDYLKAE